MVAEQVFKPKM